MSFFQLLQRSYTAIFNPPNQKLGENAIRFGLLGASNIAPIALIGPAKSHPEAVIAAVAARNPARAHAYAEKYQIPIIHNSYQELLDDETIDAVYIALPNGLHYEWALRCLQAGKHVLLEKPATSNAVDAEKLFRHPLATAVNAPIIQEAFHYQFHPAWQRFLSEVRRAGSVKTVYSQQTIPRGALAPDDIRFQFELGGGCLMDLGTYALSAARQVLNREPVEVVDAECRLMVSPRKDGSLEDQVDQYISASLHTKEGKTAIIIADIASSFEWPSFLPRSWRINIPWPTVPMCRAEMEEVNIATLPGYEDAEHLVQKTVTIWNYLLPVVWHRIDVTEKHRIVKEGMEIKAWKKTHYLKAYNYLETEDNTGAYRDWWTTWRCQLEEFIHLVKGRKGSGVKVDAQESIEQMAVIDEIYRKAGLKTRPSSSYTPNHK